MSDTIQGQPGQLAPYNFGFPNPATVQFDLFGSSLTAVGDFIAPLPNTLRCSLARSTGIEDEDVPFTITGTTIEITPALPMASGDVIVILQWNSQLRGSSGEFVAFTILNIP